MLQCNNLQAFSTVSQHPTCVSAVVLGLSSSERRVLGADVALGAGRRLEGHGAAGALVEDFAVSGLNVGLDGVQASKHHLAAGASAQGDDKKKKKGRDEQKTRRKKANNSSFGTPLHTCIRYAWRSADRPPPSASESSPAGRCRRTRGRREALGVCGSSGGRRRHRGSAASWGASTAYTSDAEEKK